MNAIAYWLFRDAIVFKFFKKFFVADGVKCFSNVKKNESRKTFFFLYFDNILLIGLKLDE